MNNVVLFFKSKLQSVTLAAISGVLIGTSYIPYPAWAIGFCYIPLWFAVHKMDSQNSSLLKIFMIGWITQFILTLIGFNWIYFTATEFGDLPPIIATAALLLFASLMHIYIPLALVAAVAIRRKLRIQPAYLIWLICCLHIFAERIWPSIFEWNLAYTFLWMKWPLAQWADTFGFWGLSALIFFFNGLLFKAIEAAWIQPEAAARIKSRFTQFFGYSAGAAALLSFFWFTGESRKSLWLKTDSKLNFAIVQASISNDAKVAAEKGLNFQGYVIDKYFVTAEKTLSDFRAKDPSQQVDLMLWPETAMPFPLDQNYHTRMNQRSLLERLGSWRTTLITGGYSMDAVKKDIHGHNVVRNSLFFLSPTGLSAGAYFKSQLLVFGEYMPLGELFPILYKWLPFVGTYERGPGATTIPVKTESGQDLRIGPQICYESLDPHFSRELSKSGSQIIVNVTNDSWFGNWAEPFQHMIMTLARGLENRRPLIRSTNTGISSAITAAGDTIFESPIDAVWGGVFELNYKSEPSKTLYTRLGAWDLFIWLLFFIFIVTMYRNTESRTETKKENLSE